MKSNEHKGAMRIFMRYIMTFRGRFLTVFGLFVISDILLAIVPVFIGQFVAALSASPIETSGVYGLVAVLIGLSITHDLFWRAGEWTYRGLLNSKLYEFENLLFRAVASKSYPYFLDKFTGKISSNIATIAREFRQFVAQICYTYADLMVKLPTIATIMFSVNVYSGLVFLTSLIVMFFSGKYLTKKTHEAERRLSDTVSSLDGYVVDIISNFVNVKAFRQEQQETEVVSKSRQKVIERSNESMFWGIIFWGSMSLIVRWVIWPATILLNVHLFLSGQIDLAQITTFLSVLLIFSDYIWGVVWNVSQFTIQRGRIEEAYGYLFGSEDVVRSYKQGKYRLEKTATPAFSNTLVFKELRFAYPDKPEKNVLESIDLSIRKNEKIGIVGASGSGKTTLIKLLLGYFELPKNMVLLDNAPISNQSLGGLIAYVPQDTTLFHRSIRDNIAYGSDDAVDQEAVERAARRAHAHEFISQINDGYEALVGERGIKLSMGQRQRIAIARALLDDKPILVLDEATSALDSESEVLVQQALEELWHDRTVIAIAHRLSTLRNMDRIVVFDKGRIVEEGSHLQLMRKKGRYFKLWQHQSGGVLVE